MRGGELMVSSLSLLLLRKADAEIGRREAGVLRVTITVKQIDLWRGAGLAVPLSARGGAGGSYLSAKFISGSTLERTQKARKPPSTACSI